MNDLGKIRNIDTVPMEAGKGKKEKHYPSVTITDEQIPDLKDKKIDSKISLNIIGVIKGIREDYDNKDKFAYEIEMHQGELTGKVSEKEYMDMSDDEKDEKDEKDMKDKKEE